jgi:hypothetical protein
MSGIPSLVLSGAFDPVTPPAYGSVAAEGLSRAQEFVLADQAHGASLGSCGATLVSRFLDDPEGPVTAVCAGSSAPPTFVAGRQQPLVRAPLEFEVTPNLSEEMLRRLAEAAERARLRGPVPPQRER